VSGQRQMGQMHRRLLARPHALAGHPQEALAAVLLCGIVAVIFVLEIATPATVVASLALIPVLAATWLLSRNRLLAFILVAAVLFGASIITETANRPTLIIVVLAGTAAATLTRLYASNLANLLAISMDQATALSPKPAQEDIRVSPLMGSLTRRELDVARLASEGHTAAEIAGRLHIGERTVESHLARTYSKLGINSRAKLIRMASALSDETFGPGKP